MSRINLLVVFGVGWWFQLGLTGMVLYNSRYGILTPQTKPHHTFMMGFWMSLGCFLWKIKSQRD